MPEQGLRVMVDGPTRGERNMAVDCWLMEQVAGDSQPVLRFYQWARPTLSLGYFQKLHEVTSLSWPDPDVDVCRRPTGGGAILHHLELTFSLTLPANHSWLKGDTEDSYLKICRPLLAVLADVGVPAEYRGRDRCDTSKPPNCFAGRACADVLAQGHKVMGTAQRRKRGSVMTHGSLLLRQDRKLWQRVFGDRMGTGFGALADYIQPPEPSLLARQLAGRWAAELGLEGLPFQLPPKALDWVQAQEARWVVETKALKSA